MINPKTLKKFGVTQAALKSLFTAKVKSPQIQKLVDRIADRRKVGVDNNMRDWRVFYAIDKAYDTPFYQSTHALLQGLADGKTSTNDVLAVMKDLNITNIGITCSCKTPGCVDPTCLGKKTIDIPAFFEVLVPIVRAYVNIRWARIYNDHNVVPLLKYEPSISTQKERLRCGVTTQRVEMQANQMNYRSYFRQAILQSLLYSTCLMFPREAWWYDQQPDEDGKLKTTREGIRYDLPHPSRFYYDLAHPIFTLNSDTGCTYAGYWQLVPYGDIADNEDYWNRDKITFGSDSFKFFTSNRNYFSLAYPCTMDFPDLKGGGESPVTGALNQEERFGKYGRNDHDKAVALTNHFELLNPLRDLGLKNKEGKGYDGNVWFRVQLASDDTVIYCEPLAYAPTRYFGCDVDSSRARNVGLALEVVPYQTAIGNFLTQAVLTAKNNLTKLVFVNTDVIDQSVMDKLQNVGEKRYRSPIIIPFSKTESTAQNVDETQAVHEVQFTPQSTVESITMIKTLLDILERVLVMSSQELAASASHEQSATEVGITAQSTSTRLAFTSSFIDDGKYAWQNQLYHAGMAYWDDEIFAQIAVESEADKKALEDLGFEVESTENRMTVGVRGKKNMLAIEGFTMRRDDADRVNNQAMAAQMVQLFQAFIGNPVLLKAVGVHQVVDTFNKIATIAGLPRDYRLNATSDPFKEMENQQGAAPEEQSKLVEAQLAQILPKAMAQMQQDTMNKVGQSLQPMTQAVEQLMDGDKSKNEAISQALQMGQQNKQVIEQLLARLAQAQPPAGAVPPQALAAV